MKIPHDPIERQRLYDELSRQCFASRNERFEFYRMARNYFLFGTADDSGAPYNKIFSTIDTLSSFIYAPDNVHFSLHLGTTADELDVYKAQPLAREIGEQWRMSGTHMRFALAVKWALVFGCMPMKVQWRRGIARTYLVEPHQFGVLREDVIDLADQEAFAMSYTTTKTQLATDLIGNPRRESILKRLEEGARAGRAGSFSEGLSRLLLSNPVGGISGSVASQSGTAGGTLDGGMSGNRVNYNYSPKVEADLINMIELYVYDDEIEDYQIATIADPDIVIYDRPQKRVGVAGMPHFAIVRPESNLYDYFWGESFVARLAWLQDWRTEDVGNIRNLLKKQSDPPVTAMGLTGIAEEKMRALRLAGGIVSSPSPAGKVEVHTPKMPENAFASLEQIDRMFDDVAGIGHILQGKGESGVRSRGQADLMARLGSSRPKNRASAVEESAQDLATLMLRSVQENSDQRFQAEIPGKPEKLTFIASQFTTDFEVRVDAHSSSPIFAEDRKTDAQAMLEAGAIDQETYLEMMYPPNLQHLQAKLKILQAKRAQAQQAEAAQEQAKGGER